MLFCDISLCAMLVVLYFTVRFTVRCTLRFQFVMCFGTLLYGSVLFCYVLFCSGPISLVLDGMLTHIHIYINLCEKVLLLRDAARSHGPAGTSAPACRVSGHHAVCPVRPCEYHAKLFKYHINSVLLPCRHFVYAILMPTIFPMQHVV